MSEATLDNKNSNIVSLTKREYFAGLAMQGLLSNPNWMSQYKNDNYLFPAEIVAKIAIEKADELLKQLSQK